MRLESEATLARQRERDARDKFRSLAKAQDLAAREESRRALQMAEADHEHIQRLATAWKRIELAQADASQEEFEVATKAATTWIELATRVNGRPKDANLLTLSLIDATIAQHVKTGRLDEAKHLCERAISLCKTISEHEGSTLEYRIADRGVHHRAATASDRYARFITLLHFRFLTRRQQMLVLVSDYEAALSTQHEISKLLSHLPQGEPSVVFERTRLGVLQWASGDSPSARESLHDSASRLAPILSPSSSHWSTFPSPGGVPPEVSVYADMAIEIYAAIAIEGKFGIEAREFIAKLVNNRKAECGPHHPHTESAVRLLNEIDRRLPKP